MGCLGLFVQRLAAAGLSSREEVSQPYPMGRRPKGSSSLECSTAVQRASHGQGIPSPISACESSLGSNGRPVLGPKTGDRTGGDGWDWVSWCNARPSSWEQFASWTRGISQQDQHRDGHAGLENGPNPPSRSLSTSWPRPSLQYNLILSAPVPECTVKMNESRETGAPVSLPSRHELPDTPFNVPRCLSWERSNSVLPVGCRCRYAIFTGGGSMHLLLVKDLQVFVQPLQTCTGLVLK